MKLVVFNVGSALCVYAEHQTTRIVFDIGKGNNFSPVNDFLLPLYEKRGEHRLKNRNNRYGISQLIVSHPHKDHISDIQEFDILELLVKNPGKVYSRDNLLKKVWGEEYPGDARTVDVHVRRLREKIESNPSEPKYVHTRWGVGYYYNA